MKIMENKKSINGVNYEAAGYLGPAYEMEFYAQVNAGPTINRLKSLIYIDINTVKNQHFKSKYLNALNRLGFRSKEFRKITIDACSFEKRIIELLNCFSGLKFLLTVNVSSNPSITILENLYLLISGLIHNLRKQEKINCLVLDVSLIEDSIYLGITHDRKGMDQHSFELLKNAQSQSKNMRSIVRNLESLNTSIAFEVGSITINSSQY
ncbi:MAG: hypothetical protein ACJAUD_001774 [Crocinitomicaceae bacterium]|jgi:hypothetical protein